MAFDAADGAPGGVRHLAEEALKAGATKEEIAEALRVAFHLSGAGCLYTASYALKDTPGIEKALSIGDTIPIPHLFSIRYNPSEVDKTIGR
ncbi:MAG: hypothetical protein MZU91_11435 [Desulfosudis oleivorans]|nr:hypothetical protein [Desulfosudis oleivorans]